MASPSDNAVGIMRDDAVLRFATSAAAMGRAPSRRGGVSRGRGGGEGRHADVACTQPEQVVGTGTHDVLGGQGGG
ncbi:MAG: hypothetical protein FWD12_15210, partial [Alphaproteobacteria bacterium]|nr:hypothetical protein [Alphaproteobacteria bacterium]